VISRITGQLAQVHDGAVEVDVHGIGYTVLVAPSASASLRGMIDQPVTLHTVYDIEGGGGGGNLSPRLVGFLDPEERKFYEKLKTVKGFGAMKALRALVVAPRKIARAIEDGDTAMLRRLPEVGARTADKIVAELKGKLEHFALGEPSREEQPEEMPAFKADAIDVLVTAGMSRTEALTKIEHALRQSPSIETTEELVSEAFRQTKKERAK